MSDMCESNVYILKDGKEELFLEQVSIIKPEKDKLLLKNIFGEQKDIKARIKEVNMVGHKIILEKTL
jgi:predicted RNA-binding protein